VLEWVKYSAYGVPHLLTPGDHDKSGEVDKDDETAFNADYGTGNLRADLDEDGDVDTDDQTLFTASFNKTTPGGRWKLSSSDVGNRKGYAGYEHEGFGNDLAAPEIAHVRNSVHQFELGRSLRSRLQSVGLAVAYVPATMMIPSSQVIETPGSLKCIVSDVVQIHLDSMLACGGGNCRASPSGAGAVALALPFYCTCTGTWTKTGRTMPASLCGGSYPNPASTSVCNVNCPLLEEETCPGTRWIPIPTGLYGCTFVSTSCTARRWEDYGRTISYPGRSTRDIEGGWSECCAQTGYGRRCGVLPF
jgi:hypothetical protein